MVLHQAAKSFYTIQPKAAFPRERLGHHFIVYSSKPQMMSAMKGLCREQSLSVCTYGVGSKYGSVTTAVLRSSNAVMASLNKTEYQSDET